MVRKLGTKERSGLTQITVETNIRFDYPSDNFLIIGNNLNKEGAIVSSLCDNNLDYVNKCKIK